MNISYNLVEKYNYPVPRYTSYPPANRFADGLESNDCLGVIEESNGWSPQNISFYVHIPFCRRLCHYCGCNSCRPGADATEKSYHNAVLREIEMIIPLLDGTRKISQIHFGGGTPNSLPAGMIGSIVEALTRRHSFIDAPEIAIECHPAHLDLRYLDELRLIGFNRFSLGIQDFNPEVLRLVNRQSPKLPVETLVTAVRSIPEATVNLDFIYGLPGQTPESFGETITAAAGIRPDRLVTFSYAHVPWVNPSQAKLEKAGLPSVRSKLAMFETAHSVLTRSGYRFTGLDHYVLPGDELDMAVSTGTLHRNFQGYCTLRTTGQVYAFGSSAISQPERVYIQNTRQVADYIALISAGKPAAAKYYRLNETEIFVRGVIDRLMCNRVIDLDAYIPEIYALSGFRPDKTTLSVFENEGIVEISGGRLRVTDNGIIFIRNVAALLDPLFEVYEKSFSKPV